MCPLIEFMEYKAWGGFLDYKHFLEHIYGMHEEGFWRDQ